MTEGKLTVTNKGKLQVNYTNKKGISGNYSFSDSELSQPLLEQKEKAIAQLEGLEVEFEEVGGQPKKIREKGKAFESNKPTPPPAPPQAIPATPTKTGTQQTTATRKQISSGTTQTQQNANAHNTQSRPGNFHNPYNFIPSPPRNTKDPDLGDRLPVGHGSYRQDYWSGKISVSLKTVTPLLIPDAANATGEPHKTYPIRKTHDNKPILPPTSIKGMVRCAYETVTNSRFGIFEGHSERLAYRLPATMGIEMVPARIENNKICLYPGTSAISSTGKPAPGDPMYAAWLPRYRRNNTNATENKDFTHGQKVNMWVEKIDKVGKNNNTIFSYWRVIAIAASGKNIQEPQQETQSTSSHLATGDRAKFTGYVFISKKNIDKKHDERVFFTEDDPIPLELTPELKDKWAKLIINYQDIHKSEIEKGLKCPPALNNSEWSRHVTGGDYEQSLKEGTLLYAHVKPGNQYKVLGLYPVMISRNLYNFSPDKLLADTLKPASSKDELSPSDRVFGWVKQEGSGSYKGNLRISDIHCTTNDAIEEFGDQGFPLGILGQPKPEQGRFYQAKDKQGTPLPNASEKGDNYSSESQGLRGRKVYPHHQGLPSGYWNNPKQDRTQQANNGHYQEYRRPGDDNKNRDDQNRSIKAWVKPGVEFKFTIDVINLSQVELGALLWLLTLPDNHYHRLGGGKPLGFGSVKLNIDWDNTDLRKGQDWQNYYGSLLPIPKPDFNTDQSQSCINKFQEAVAKTYGSGGNFEQVSFIAAFCRSAQGFNDNLPTHYPRTQAKPNAEGEGFQWFTENEKAGRDNSGLKLSLPSLVSDPEGTAQRAARGLPFQPTKSN